MGEQTGDQEHNAEPARPPLNAACARKMTAGLREAMDDVRRSVAVLAARVRDAHAARVWLPLGHSRWKSYCAAEFGISRAQAYRLLDVARSLAAIHGAVTAGTETSRTRDSDPAAADALDYGLSQRALIAVSSRAEDVAELITRRLATLAHSGLQALDEATCAPWSARPSATSAPPRPRRPPIHRRTRPSPRCAASPTTSPPAPTRSGSWCSKSPRPTSPTPRPPTSWRCCATRRWATASLPAATRCPATAAPCTVIL
ncbi:hypothetical protein [Streptomyces longispororuber]|uniref:hypothetical protein n=1 Tax=Streptomyces longispororuber TaxID=68230 RepID=UPI001E496386|nr:hypothetical protein [Streptomyces longispororuber]